MLILFVALILAMVAFGIGLLLLAKPFLKIYVSDSYYDAWRYTPFFDYWMRLFDVGDIYGNKLYRS